jgi:endonuclease/exonuclease/phosphatase family metal-dependent hydrolase
MVFPTCSGGNALIDRRCWLPLCFVVALSWNHDSGALAAVARGPGPREPGYFEALTYNVAGLPEGISAAHPATATPRISGLLNRYDLVFLQEDFCYHAELVGAADHPFRTLPQVAWTTLVNDGLTQLSRFALADFERVRWPVASGIVDNCHDCLASKGFAMATARLGAGATLHIYNLHGDAGSSAADRDARCRSYAMLAEIIRDRSAGHAVLVAGDFNLDLEDPIDCGELSTLLARTGLVDAGFALNDPRPGIDRFLFRSGAAVELEPLLLQDAAEFVDEHGAPLSDHPAMRSRWRWRLRERQPAPDSEPATLATLVAGDSVTGDSPSGQLAGVDMPRHASVRTAAAEHAEAGRPEIGQTGVGP